MHRRFPAPPHEREARDDRRTMPAELLTEFCDADFGSELALLGDGELLPDARGLPLSVELSTLARFKELMAAEGWPVQTARMVFDRVYAHERLAFGHTSADQGLRALALELFRRLHAGDDGAGAGSH